MHPACPPVPTSRPSQSSTHCPLTAEYRKARSKAARLTQTFRAAAHPHWGSQARRRGGGGVTRAARGLALRAREGAGPTPRIPSPAAYVAAQRLWPSRPLPRRHSAPAQLRSPTPPRPHPKAPPRGDRGSRSWRGRGLSSRRGWGCGVSSRPWEASCPGSLGTAVSGVGCGRVQARAACSGARGHCPAAHARVLSRRGGVLRALLLR